MVTKSDIDFGNDAIAYARYRAGFPDSFFQRLKGTKILGVDLEVLDLGTGTGTLARGLAKRGLRVTGLDPSIALLAQADKLAETDGVQIAWVRGRAESTGLSDAAFDIVIAGQCWHWFEHDAAMAEIRRLLLPDGVLVVAYFDWIDKPGNPVDLMYELRRKYNPKWGSSWPLGAYPQGPNDLRLDGFEEIAAFEYNEDITYSHEAWRGRMRAYAGIGGSLPASVVEEFDAEFKARLAERFTEDPMAIPHRV